MWDGDVRFAMRITAPLARGFGLTAYGNSGSQLTLCWREQDSNFRFRARMATVLKPSYFVYFPETVRALPKDPFVRGTTSSNPFPSSGELGERWGRR
jgi:hypothetical protein